MKLKIILLLIGITIIAVNSLKIKNKQLFYSPLAQMQSPIINTYSQNMCECAYNFPPCCTKELELYVCPCAVKPICGDCINGVQSLESPHDTMLKFAMNDAFNQQNLANKAKLQVELFQKAQDFAKEIGVQELKAKKYANEVNEITNKAQVARNMLAQATNQFKFLNDETGRTLNLLTAPLRPQISQIDIINQNSMFPQIENKDNNNNVIVLSDDPTIVRGLPSQVPIILNGNTFNGNYKHANVILNDNGNNNMTQVLNKQMP